MTERSRQPVSSAGACAEERSEHGAEAPTSSPSPQPVIRHEAWWWVAEDGEPPVVPGFVLSAFNPLVAAVADRCLSEHYAKPPEPPSDRQRTGLVLVSRGGDRVSAEHVRQTVADGHRLGPLFFFQSVPNSILGHVTARWGLGGPVVCISPVGPPVAEGIAEAALLMSDGDAEEVLLVIAEQAADVEDGAVGCAHALLLGWPAEPATAGQVGQPPAAGQVGQPAAAGQLAQPPAAGQVEQPVVGGEPAQPVGGRIG